MSHLDWLLLLHRTFSRIVLAQEGLDDRALPSTKSIRIRKGIKLVLAPVEGFGGACQVLKVYCKARVQLGPAGWIDLQALLVLEVHVCPLEGPLQSLAALEDGRALLQLPLFFQLIFLVLSSLCRPADGVVVR